LGAFFNAVFLIALCVSIFLEAIKRLFDPPTISEPVLVLIVGSIGLVSNLVGFVILGGHGHSHGHEEHSHGDAHDHTESGHHTHQYDHCRDDSRAAEEGRSGNAAAGTTGARNDVEQVDLFPEAAVARFSTQSEPVRHISFHDADAPAPRESIRSDTLERCTSGVSTTSRGRQRGRSSASARHGRITSIDDISIHPASFRQEIIAASRSRDIDEDSDTAPESPARDEDEHQENTPLITRPPKPNGASELGRQPSHSRRSRRESTGLHRLHHHSKPKKERGGGGHGHSHADMGMRAMVLHVIGDALGNVGVIVTALIIWLTTSKYRWYSDPIVSLIIGLIILKSAIPLTKAAAKILLQATPEHIDINEIREDIQDLPGVVSCHHIHVWQLSDTKIVASLHIEMEFPITEGNGEKYMALAMLARKCLHAHGIHSATIQPEFNVLQHAAMSAGGGGGDGNPAMGMDGSSGMPARLPPASSCLLGCVDNCAEEGCCSTGSKTGSRPASMRSTQSGKHNGHGSHHSSE